MALFSTLNSRGLGAAPLTAAAQLAPNFPNPFNPTTAIRFQLSQTGDVQLAVFDVLGREVARLVDGQMPAGSHTVRFDGSRLTSGVYFCELTAGGVTQTREMLLLK